MWLGRNRGARQSRVEESSPGQPDDATGDELVSPPGAEDGPETATLNLETGRQQGPPGRAFWQMGLVVTASALCGGIAVVLWNRRLLTKMREVVPVARTQQARLWEDDL